MLLTRPHGASCTCHVPPELAALVDVPAQDWVPMPRRGTRPLVVPTIADQIVTGRIVTMSAAQPQVEAVAVTDGRITATGSRADISGLAGPKTEVVDLGDHVAYPGFIEPHMHYWGSAMFYGWTDVSTRGGRTFDEVIAVLKDAKPIDGWILGNFYDPALVPGQRELTRADLDAIHPDTPVFVMNASMHWAYVNSAALAAAKLTDDSPQPEGGEFRKVDGRLDGAIGELAGMAPFLAVLPRKDKAALTDAMVQINAVAASRGYTHTHDAGTGGLLGADEPQIIFGLRDRFLGRVTYAVLDQVADTLVAAGLRPGDGDDKVRALSWKLVADGSNQGYSGYQSANYLGKDFRGKPNYTPAQLVERIGTARRHGFPVMIHANGDAAITEVIDAYEEVLRGGSGLTRRDRVEHCSFASRDDLVRMARIGLSPTFLVAHVYYWGRAFRDDIVGPEKAAGLDPIATALSLGLRCSTHSDYTVTEFEPLREIQTAVTRVMRDGGEVLGPDERIPVAAAMRLKTVDAAWQVHADGAGVLEPGRFADLTVLERDPQQVDPSTIADIGIVSTIVGGTTVYSG